jgi:hypothetical protein
MSALKWIGFVVAVPVVFVAGIFVVNKISGPVGWAKADVEKNLRAQMKDPDSMVIRSSFVVKRKMEGRTEISVCGTVDGKNNFGGYTGGMRFASRSVSTKNTFDTYTVKIEDPRDLAQARNLNILSTFEKIYWNEFCVDERHPALTASSE